MILPTLNIDDPNSIAILNSIAGKLPNKRELFFKDIALLQHYLKCSQIEITGYGDLFNFNIIFESKYDKIIFNPIKYLNYSSLERKEFNHQFYNFTLVGKRFIDM
jgi:hypothetical protein